MRAAQNCHTLKNNKRYFTMHADESKAQLLSRVRVVMVETSHPGNVGSAARAMLTMGISDMVLVAPKDRQVLTHRDAHALSASAASVLAGARVVETIEAALSDCHFAIGFTARKRELSHAFKPLREAAQIACAEAIKGRVALVFGNEAMCLSNEQAARCQLISAIPSNPASHSLNVSQAVQVACYELMMTAAAFSIPADPQREAASAGEVEYFLRALEDAAIRANFLDASNPKRFDTRMRRLFTRARLEPEEVAILRGVLAALVAKH